MTTLFVTLGTTKFDTLIKYIDSNIIFTPWDIEFQIANGTYIPKNYPYFDFVDTKTIEQKYHDADIVITHAGCGTIYKLLDMRKKFIIVPNMERNDKHQLDIAKYMDKNHYALVAYKMEQLESLLHLAMSSHFRQFDKDSFFKAEEIITYILNPL